MSHSFPASFAQQRLWFLDQLESGTAAYNLARAFRITGPLETTCLAGAIRGVVQRHESLRTVFESVDGQAQQVVLADVNVDLRVVDLSSLPESDCEAEALRLAGEEAKKPFDLTQGPLFRNLLIRLDSNHHLLVLALHHIITDGWSIAILFRELTKSYEALVNGSEPNLPELPVQYPEYARWQRDYISGDVLREHVQYWKNRLAGAPTVLELPTDHPRPATHSWHGGTEELVLSPETLDRLKALANREGATPFMVSMAAFQALLWRYTLQDSILVGTPVAGRKELEIENLIGFFVNTLVFRADFHQAITFRDLIRQIRGFSLDAYAHQDVPFEKLVEELVPQRSMDTTPLFQVMFTFQNIPKQVFQIPGLDIQEVPFETGISKFDLSVDAYEDEGLHFRFEYNSDLFERETVVRMMRHLERLVIAAIETPDQALIELPLITPEEERKVVLEWNRTESGYPSGSAIHTVFEKQAKLTPDATALLWQGSRITCRTLNEQANRLAHYLMAEGTRPGHLVAVALDRSPEMIVTLLAILKTGAAYVPLDPSYPAERLAVMIEDSKVWGIVTSSTYAEKFRQSDAERAAEVVHLISLDKISSALESQSPDDPQLAISGEQRAYVIYTSGSTGTPKGVEATHRACLNRFSWMWQRYPFASDEVCCQKTNLTFVDSIWEIFGPILAGVPNVIIPQDVVHDPEELIQILARTGVTRLVLVPSLLRMLLDHAPNLEARLPRLKFWSCSGEVLPVDLAKHFRAAHPGATLLNIYGSSEVAADVSCYQVGDLTGMTSVPIGSPISNTQIYILDRHRKPTPIGIPGEIYVGGDGVALGYWKRPDLTAERFVDNPLPAAASTRLFRTGDLGRWRGDGTIEYLARVDSQVKLRGIRLELGEVEATIASHADVREAAVLLTGDPDQQRLIAYLTSTNGHPPRLQDLRRHVRTKLPEHMLPASYVLLERMPLLLSGKVNRKALSPALGKTLSDEAVKTPPRTDTEKKLASMWQELLKVEDVGTEQNFFELGGHSLLVLQVIARIRKAFEVEIPVRVVFEQPTIAEIAAEVEKALAAGEKVRTPILQRRARPAAASQEALLAHLDTLSAAEVQALLQRVLNNKQPAPAASLSDMGDAAAVGEK